MNFTHATGSASSSRNLLAFSSPVMVKSTAVCVRICLRVSSQSSESALVFPVSLFLAMALP